MPLQCRQVLDASTLDDLVRHFGVRRIMAYRVEMPDCGTISPGLYSCA
jgi:hypothetical protein